MTFNTNNIQEAFNFVSKYLFELNNRLLKLENKKDDHDCKCKCAPSYIYDNGKRAVLLLSGDCPCHPIDNPFNMPEYCEHFENNKECVWIPSGSILCHSIPCVVHERK